MKNRATRVQSGTKSATDIRLPLMFCALLAEGVLLRAVAGTTDFPGGSLSALTALSPSLTFDHLLISGPLQLPAASSTKLRVNQLTISPSGSVGYTYTDCQYDPAPSITIDATGQVIINGPITLRGRSGTRTTDSATCNQPWGCDGGQVWITAKDLTVAAVIETSGGAGSTMVSSYGSSGCAGGDAGAIHLEATNQLVLTAAAVNSQFGKGGTGSISGEPNSGADGAAAEVHLISHNQILMTGSTVTSSGPVALQAQQSSIWGPITGNTLNATIAGNPDQQAPQVNIVAPAPNTVLTLGQPLEVRIQAQDSGAGLREIQLEGLGYSQTHSAAEMVNGVLTVTISQPVAPAAFQVIARDNLGNSTTAAVSGLSLAGNVNVAEGETLNVTGDLLFGPEISVNIAGTVLIKHGINPKITAGSLRVAATGTIKDEDVGPEEMYSKAPSVEIVVRGQATIDGTIDLSGNQGWKYYTDSAGDLTIRAAGISVGGTVNANGAYSERSEGGSGGVITLASSLSLQISGTLSANGGTSGFYRGGNGGKIVLNYLTTVDLTGASLSVAAGSGWQGSGNAGTSSVNYLGNPNSPVALDIAEVEPNNQPANAQVLPSLPVRIHGTVAPDDVGQLSVSGDDYEDLFRLRLTTPRAVKVELIPSAADVDLDLIVANASDYTILGYSMNDPATTSTERIDSLDLSTGSYLILVSQYGDTPVTGTAYTLSVRPGAGADTDGDGMADWWEMVHFGSLDHNGTVDSDSDGLTDRQEYDHGTHPLVADTDGDGITDGAEVAQGSNPLVDERNNIRVQAGSRPGPSGFLIRVQGGSGQRVVLQRSQDLKTWEDWTTVTCTGAFLDVPDPDGGKATAGFYRAHAL